MLWSGLCAGTTPKHTNDIWNERTAPPGLSTNHHSVLTAPFLRLMNGGVRSGTATDYDGYRTIDSLQLPLQSECHSEPPPNVFRLPFESKPEGWIAASSTMSSNERGRSMRTSSATRFRTTPESTKGIVPCRCSGYSRSIDNPVSQRTVDRKCRCDGRLRIMNRNRRIAFVPAECLRCYRRLRFTHGRRQEHL